jgi:hypothetical protein
LIRIDTPQQTLWPVLDAVQELHGCVVRDAPRRSSGSLGLFYYRGYILLYEGGFTERVPLYGLGVNWTETWVPFFSYERPEKVGGFIHMWWFFGSCKLYPV